MEETDPLANVRRGRNGSTRVSQLQWWKFMIQIRASLWPILLAGRLFHEVIFDASALIMMSRPDFRRRNQAELR